MADIKYRPGQVWNYKHRDCEPLSTLTVLKLTTLPLAIRRFTSESMMFT